ncbi:MULTISPECIES: hypothetical protein [Bacillaceae]|uniref:Uncharacterized protein n=1 Tax=Gottfriedia luciferensis TaxID=178774 RepID=A0ABX3A221_9BACI|nr:MULTISPECIES: hypothetical protein [Bacillaceae]ODG93363.1 hypothetical protein BED47_03480 [Gottfriedia luciferensis]PGZ94981.1 hypothetical protein COE53_00025 [Bacillus sp. AFS029533]SFC49252.1 hypothetical protein SAMN02799633_00984 [Bacillus sp. UNCCL81]
MFVKIEFEYEKDTVYFRCPAKVGRNIRQLQQDFFRWLNDRNNDHPFWVSFGVDEDGNEEFGLSYNEDAFIYWLNNVRFNKGKKVAVLIKNPKFLPKKTISF